MLRLLERKQKPRSADGLNARHPTHGLHVGSCIGRSVTRSENITRVSNGFRTINIQTLRLYWTGGVGQAAGLCWVAVVHSFGPHSMFGPGVVRFFGFGDLGSERIGHRAATSAHACPGLAESLPLRAMNSP